MKSRYFIFISYRGTSFKGWQIQPNGITVQEVLDNALTTITGEAIRTTGAGRTDTGVHAAFFCAHFDSGREDLDLNGSLVFRLNRFLPPDISVKSIIRVKDGAHARFSAISRTYRYYIARQKDPFAEGASWFIYGDLDIENMNRACELLQAYTDFTSFSRLHTDVRTNNCRIFEASWQQDGHMLVFSVRADRFLRNMVRAIVGTMVQLGQGKITIDEFEDIIRARDRGRAGRSAPAEGLFLKDIEYPPDIYYQSE